MQITVTFTIKKSAPNRFGAFMHDDLKTVFFEALDRCVTGDPESDYKGAAREWLYNNVVSTQESPHGS